MTTVAIGAAGGTVAWSTTASGYVTIAECKTLLVPAVSPEYIDVTSLDSTSGFREYIVGLKDPGEITLECNYTGAVYSSAKTYGDAGALVYFETTLAQTAAQTVSGDSFTFAGYVVPSVPAVNTGEEVKLELSIRLTGDVTYAAGT